MNKQQLPEFERGAAFIFKYQVVTSESESQIRLFSPFPTLPDVNIDGVHAIILESNAKLSRMQYRVAQAGCNNLTFNESHVPVLQQMENMHNHLKTEINEAQSELNTLSAIAESFFPPIASLGTPRQRRSIDVEEPHNRTRRLIGAVAALAAGTGFILDEPIKNAACNALSIFNLCDSTDDLERELDEVTKQQKTQQQAFQTVQDQNNEKLALLRDEIRLTQESVERIKNDTYTHISYMLKRIYTLEDAFRCYQFEGAHRHFLQSSQLYLSQIGTLYTHFKTFRAAFYAYRNNFFSIISSLATGYITPQFLLPNQLATIVQELAAEEFRKGSKLTPAIPSGFEAIYYELQIVLEVTMLPNGISFVLGIPMNSKSATYNVFQAEPLYQPNDDGKMASVYQFPKPYVAIATDNTNFAELAASTLQQCTGSNRIKLCRKGFSTTTDETLLCLTSLYFNQDIPALRNCPVSSVLLPDAPHAIYLANGVYHLISRRPTMDIKNDSRTNGLSLSTIDCQACVLRPSCESTIYINQGDLVLSPDMDACKTTPEPYIATIKLAPPLNQVFQNVPFDQLNFPSYSIGAARKSILESVQLELTEIPDVRRMDPETLQKLTEPIVAHYTSLNPATQAALDNFVPAKTSFLIAGGSIALSLFLFLLNFPLLHRQARTLCCAPRRFFKNKSGQFIHVTDDINPDSDSSFLIITREEFTALRALAKEALLKTEATAPFTYSADDEARMYPDITTQTRTIRTTSPLVLTTFTPAPVAHVDTTQTTSA